MYFTGLAIAVCTFLIIGLFHPFVIKFEYYFGTRQWWLFLWQALPVSFSQYALKTHSFRHLSV